MDRRTMGLVLVLALALTGGCRAEAEPGDATGGGGGAVATRSLEGDLAFVDGVVPRHQVDMFLADDAVARANRPELRAHAKRLKAERAKAIADLKRRRAAWVGEDETPPVDTEPQATIPAGAAFDRVWAQTMLRQHQSTIELAERALREAQQEETRTLARRVVARERAEQAALQRMLAAWGG